MPFADALPLLVPAAFLAGLLSFLSPCMLPILPAYFAFTFGTHGDARGSLRTVAVTSVAFFLGLATTLSIAGAGATALGQVLFQHMRTVTLVGGLIVIAFGVMSVLGKGFSGPQLTHRPAAGITGSYLYGATFALGWSTCIGPILGALLTLLATGGLAAAQGALLAFVYALGLGAPMIAIALLFTRLGSGTAFWRLVRGRGFALALPSAGPLRGQTLYLHSTGVLTGGLMIAMGLMVATGQLTAFTQAAASSDLSLWVIEMEEHIRTAFGLP